LVNITVVLIKNELNRGFSIINLELYIVGPFQDDSNIVNETLMNSKSQSNYIHDDFDYDTCLNLNNEHVSRFMILLFSIYLCVLFNDYQRLL
jgi:hypothetical protein